MSFDAPVSDAAAAQRPVSTEQQPGPASEVVIAVRGLGKSYRIYERPHHRLLQGLLGTRRQFFREFWALRDVDFEVRRGETFGIVGRNGSGKSTLLQILSGTLTPTIGSVEVNGRVAALLELGAGFNPDCSGRENVYMNGRLFGLSTAQIEERFDQIAAFADIGTFIDQPVKTYSSGMYVRLAFAVIAHVDADVLVVDEALSVGDAFFVQKCMRFLRRFMEQGTLLFVSHDTSAVINLCSRAMLLEGGSVRMIDTPKKVTEKYLEALYEQAQGKSSTIEPRPVADEPGVVRERPSQMVQYRDAREDLIRSSNLRNDIEVFRFNEESGAFGAGEARIASVSLTDEHGVPLAWTLGAEMVCLRIVARAGGELRRPILGFLMKDRLGQVVFGDNTYLSYRHDAPVAPAGSELVAEFEFSMPLLPAGDYSFSVAIADGTQESHVQHHWLHDALLIRAHASRVTFGVIGIPMKRVTLHVR